MKFNRYNKKIRQTLIASLASLSAFGGSANAMQTQYPVVQGPQVTYIPQQPMVVVQQQPSVVQQQPAVVQQQPAVQPVIVQTQASQQDSVGDYLIKKQAAKDLKAIRETEVWKTKDTGLQVLFLGVPIASTAYHAHTGALQEFYDAALGSGGLISKYKSNPFEHDDRDKSTMKTVEEWGINAMDIALLPKNLCDLAKTVKCYRKDLQLGGLEDMDKEPDNSRMYEKNKKDPVTGETMDEYDNVVRSRYRFDRIKNLSISELQKKIIKNESIDESNLVWDGMKIGLPIVAGVAASATHAAVKLVQKTASSVGNVIDKQQTISVIKASRS